MCQYANPIKMRFRVDSLLPVEFKTDLQSLGGFFNDGQIENMAKEWSEYIGFCKRLEVVEGDLSADYVMERISSFWQENRFKFRALAEFVQFCFSIVTSSAAAERLFSV